MVSLMFTNVDDYGGPNQPFYGVTEGTWGKYLEGTKPEDFYIKLYVGPNFCHSYDIYKNSVPEDDKGGYYVTTYFAHENKLNCRAKQVISRIKTTYFDAATSSSPKNNR